MDTVGAHRQAARLCAAVAVRASAAFRDQLRYSGHTSVSPYQVREYIYSVILRGPKVV